MTIFNVSLNARIDSGRLSEGEYRASLADWREDPGVHGPLDSSTFMDIERFEETLSLWVVSFLAGLGIQLEDAGKNGQHARRVAANCYGFFNRDVDHEPLLPPVPSDGSEGA